VEGKQALMRVLRDVVVLETDHQLNHPIETHNNNISIMLGIAVGLVSAAGLLTLFNRDPAAVESLRKERQEAREKQESALKQQRE
jgi:hypothetical protein